MPVTEKTPSMKTVAMPKIKNLLRFSYFSRVLLFALLCQPAFALEAGLEEYGEEDDRVLHVNAAAAAEILLKYPSVKVLDVRTRKEYKAGHLPDATNVDYYASSFKEQLDKLDKRTTWLVHCRTGVRSGNTLPIMRELGFESIVHLKGGITAWVDDGQPVQK